MVILLLALAVGFVISFEEILYNKGDYAIAESSAPVLEQSNYIPEPEIPSSEINPTAAIESTPVNPPAPTPIPVEKTEEELNKKIAYLTFDDGPSPKVTPQILDILKANEIKATFFVTGKMAERYPEVLKRIHAEGHLIANHSYSHSYGYIYSSPKNLIKDIEKAEHVITSILGEEHSSKIMRFPGGSFGKKLSFKKAVQDSGYKYVDWNVVNGDAEGFNVPVSKLLQRLKATSVKKNPAIILMHDIDTKKTTVDALPEILDYLKSQDYIFKTLENYEF